MLREYWYYIEMVPTAIFTLKHVCSCEYVKILFSSYLSMLFYVLEEDYVYLKTNFSLKVWIVW